MRISSLISFISQSKDFEAGLIIGANNRFYFSGVMTSEGSLVIVSDAAYLFVDSRYFEECKKTAQDCEVVLLTDFRRQLRDLIVSGKRIAVDVSSVNVAELARIKRQLSPLEVLETPELESYILKKREVKDAIEQAYIKESQRLLDLGYEYLLGRVVAGMTELDLALELEFFLRKCGAQAVSFDFILLSGENTSKPHGRPKDRKIKLGDLILVDFGVKYNGYCSDMTRTFAIHKTTSEQQEIYDIVLRAQNLAIEGIKPNRACKDIDSLARDYINKCGFAGSFGHGLGHGVGLNIHENPTLGPKSEEIVVPGAVFTIEPGIYLEDRFGIRIEDTIIITEDGYENISKSPKRELITI